MNIFVRLWYAIFGEPSAEKAIRPLVEVSNNLEKAQNFHIAKADRAKEEIARQTAKAGQADVALAKAAAAKKNLEAFLGV